MSLATLGFDLLLCIAENLSAKDLIQLSSTCKALWAALQNDDLLWKRLCDTDYGLTYNHPKQTYFALYRQSAKRVYGRLPCRHLRWVSCPTTAALEISTCYFQEEKHQREKLCICMHCRKTLCERHARWHTRAYGHELFFKPNMAEIFCQSCVDWLGGKDADPAEQYYATLIGDAWMKRLFKQEEWQDMVSAREQRRHERWLRWHDTPSRVVSNPKGYCFVSAEFMWEWEQFVEGWRTWPPWEVKVNHHYTTNMRPLLRMDPFSRESSDLVIVSLETWEYLEKTYDTGGVKITEEDLVHSEIWKHLLMRYKDRVSRQYT